MVENASGTRRSLGFPRGKIFLVVVLAAVMGSLRVAGEENPRPRAGKGNPVILASNRTCYWRWFVFWETPLIREGTRKLVTPRLPTSVWTREVACPTLIGDRGEHAEMWHSAFPSPDWMKVDFDDSRWCRFRGPWGWHTPETASLYFRGKFRVSDPSLVSGLHLLATFWGGVVVYLNGKEVGRAYMPDGPVHPETLAREYPGNIQFGKKGASLERTISLSIPLSFLRKGTNVLALEFHRAPTPLSLFKRRIKGFYRSLLKVKSVSLSASSPRGVLSGIGRPRGVLVRNWNVLLSVTQADYGDPFEPLRPIKIICPRGGVSSAQLVVSSSTPIEGLTVDVTDLRCMAGRGKISGSAVEILYPRADGSPEQNAEYFYPKRPWPKKLWRFDALLPVPPHLVPVDEDVGGATQPIWVRVRTPRKARPGMYKGKITIRMKGTVPVTNDLLVKVCSWRMPDTRKFCTHVGLIQSPDSVALYYEVPMWSEKHWRLIERSFSLLGEVGTDVIYIPLICHTHFGNEHSMVRWIPAGKGRWTYDFSIVDQYIDTAVKYLGKVPVVCFYTWEVFTDTGYLGKNMPIPFSVWEKNARRVVRKDGPRWGTPEARTFWKPVFDELKSLLRKKGLEKSMMIGLAGDARPRKETVEDLKSATGGLPWVQHCHPYKTKLHGEPIGYLAHVWGIKPNLFPEIRRCYGWRNPRLETCFPRQGAGGVGGVRSNSSFVVYRLLPEAVLTSPGKTNKGLRGFGRIGADFWKVLRNKKGRRWGTIIARYPESDLKQLSLFASVPAVLAPGPEGAVSTVRFEMMREGVQETEARIFIEKALLDPEKQRVLGEDLIRRCRTLLDERVKILVKTVEMRDKFWLPASTAHWLSFVSSGWEKRTELLYELAGEVAGRIGMQ